MGIQEKIKELEDELHRTQKNKATEYHLGILKGKIAKLKREIIAPKKGGAGAGGFDVRKSGDSTVVFIGLPSTGKSTLLNALTNAESKVAAYEFTTLTCIPGILNHKGAKIQLLDLPGIVAGAKQGKGRGREILAVARNADLILLVLDVFQPHQFTTLKNELEGIGIRLDQPPPDVTIKTLQRGGISIKSTVKLTKLNERMIIGLLNEYGIHNGEIVLREDILTDQLIDVLAGNRKYLPSLTLLNKVDLVSQDYLKQLNFQFFPVSAEKKQNIDGLKEEIYTRLRMIRIYTKPRMGDADLKEPMMMRTGSSVADACDKLHRELRKDFKYAQIWGPSAKFPGQKVGMEHILADGDVVFIAKKQGSL